MRGRSETLLHIKGSQAKMTMAVASERKEFGSVIYWDIKH